MRADKNRLRRTMMFLNAKKPSLIKDPYIYKPDSIMLDLEDAVAENQKDAARFSLYHALQEWENYLLLDIADDGCGMDSETLKQIFTPFFTTKKAGEGTGLGLALAEQIIVSHKGHIYAESEQGKGSVFHICLPILEIGTQIMVSETDGGRKLRIVAADDNRKVLDLLNKNFAKIGLPIVTCGSKSELAGILEQEKPDVLVLDESLDQGSGVEFCMSLVGKHPQMIRIIMTDAPSAEILEAKHKKIIDEYLIKPVSDTEILRAVMDCRSEPAG